MSATFFGPNGHCTCLQGRIQDFGLGGGLAGGMVDGISPAVSRGRAPVRSGGKAPGSPKIMLRHEAKKPLTEGKKQVDTD